MPPNPGEIAFVLVGGTLLPVGQLHLLWETFTIGVGLGGVPFVPSVTFEGTPADATRWALAQGCRPVCLVGADLTGPDGAELLALLAGRDVWLWNYRGRTFERMAARTSNRELGTGQQNGARDEL